MKYLCPSCKMHWEDDQAPLSMVTEPLCVFCSTKHSQKELLNWQSNHIDNIDMKYHGLVLRHFYRYVENEINLMQGRLDALEDKKESDGDKNCECR